MTTPADLQRLLSDPNETLSLEYKSWLDLRENPGKATLAKAAIALANHGGGIIVLGMTREDPDGPIRSQPRPEAIRRYTQDDINAAINRYADPELHCELLFAADPGSGTEHACVIVSGGLAVPVMSSRGCMDVIASQRCYIRKPGPRSEEPFTADEWRGLLDRCVRAGREDMLDAIRLIVQGRAGTAPAEAASDLLTEFANRARARWEELAIALPAGSAGRLAFGHYELAFELVGVAPAHSLAELLRRLDAAHQIKLTGWTPFVRLHRAPLAPAPVGGGIEAWLGQPGEDRHFYDASHCDFWRAEPDGRLFLLRGFDEDSTADYAPGAAFDVTLPVWRVGEAMLYAERVARVFGDDLSIITRCRYVGLRGRLLVSLDRRRLMFEDRRATDDEVVVEIQATYAEIRDNLAEVLRQLLAPLYERFEFFELPAALVTQELERLTQGRF
jgi:hypothetical protein